MSWICLTSSTITTTAATTIRWAARTFNGPASDYYRLPLLDPSGVPYTTEAHFPSGHQHCCATISVIYSTDAGQTWQGPLPVSGAQSIVQPPYVYANTTFRSGILE